MSKPRIILVHGIESAGVKSVDRLGHLLAGKGWIVEDVELRQTRWYNGRSLEIRNDNLRRIREVHRPGDHVIAHSNGCRLVWACMAGGTRFGKVFLFAPALDSDVVFTPCAYDSITVFANPHDKAVLAGSVLLGHRWGMMGRRGYVGVSDRVDTVFRPERSGLGHGHYFEPDYIADSMAVIEDRIHLPMECEVAHLAHECERI